jgi:ribonuclease E
MPELCNKIRQHQEPLPLFSFYGLEERLSSLFERKVQLPSGGTIVIEQTEALVSIDVNSARNRASGDVEQTAFMTNLEAVNGIAEQLVLRDLGGLIIIDFIDMESRDHQRMVQLALRRALGTDKAKIQIAALSRFGLVEMTRQRTRPSHKLLASMECPYCVGTGAVKTAETFEIDCMRSIREALAGKALSRLEVVVPQEMAVILLNARHKELAELEEQFDCRVLFTGDSLMKAREFRLIPTVRKGEGRGREREQPIRPSLLAPLLVERAKALQLARELSAMKPEQLEKDLAEGEITRRTEEPEAEPAAPAPVPQVAMAAKAATVWEEAAVLRRLLFSPNNPVEVARPAPRQGSLASPSVPANVPAHSSRNRRRRR